jgi:hypothetical protein
MALAISLAFILTPHFLLKNLLRHRWSVSGAGRIVLKKRVRSEEQSARTAPPRTTSNYF